MLIVSISMFYLDHVWLTVCNLSNWWICVSLWPLWSCWPESHNSLIGECQGVWQKETCHGYTCWVVSETGRHCGCCLHLQLKAFGSNGRYKDHQDVGSSDLRRGCHVVEWMPKQYFITFFLIQRHEVKWKLGWSYLWMANNGDWSDTRLAFHTLAGREKVHFALFDAGRNNIVSRGRRHVSFWPERHSTLVLSKGVLSENCIHEAFVCGVLVNESLLITRTKSCLFDIWKEMKIVEEIKAHNDCVVSLWACPEGFISVCAKGIVILWSANLQKVASNDVFAKSTSSPIGTIDMISHSNRCETTKMLILTESRDICETSCVTGIVSLLCKIGLNQPAPYAEPNPIYQPMC